MEMIAVNSSSVEAIGHDEPTKTMQVNFLSGGQYLYEDISTEEHKSIMGDKSIGSKLKKVAKDKLYHKLS